MAKLVPSRPQIGVGMGTCGAGNGAEGVYHAFAEAIDRQGRDIKLASVGCFGFCAQEPLVNVRLPGKPAGDPAARGGGRRAAHSRRHGRGRSAAKTWRCARSKSGTTSRRTSCTATGFPKIPNWNEVPFFKPQKKIVLRNCGLISPDDIEEYIAIGGYSGAL